MAAPSPARKPVASAQGDARRLPKWFLDQVRGIGGYTPRPKIVTRRLYRCCTNVELGVIDCLLDATIGAAEEDYPEWASVTYREFAELLGVDEAGVRKAVRLLEDRGLIESKDSGRDGRVKQYRLLIANWPSAPERPKPQDSEEADVEESTVCDDNTATPVAVLAKVTVQPGASKRATVGHTPYEFRNRTKLALDVVASGTPERIFIDLRDNYRYSSSGISDFGADGAPPPPPAAARNGTHPRGRGNLSNIFDRHAQVRDALAPLFLKEFKKPLDDALVGKIERALGAATVESFMALVHQRMRKGKIETGLFVHLASDARLAAEELAKRAGKPSPPPPPTRARPRPHEDENSGSLWSQIRAFLRQRLTREAYSNWMRDTAQVKTVSGSGKLLVAVPDETTIGFLEHEYAAEIRDAIERLKLPVERIEYVVPAATE